MNPVLNVDETSRHEVATGTRIVDLELDAD